MAARAGAWARMRPLLGGIASRPVVTTLGDRPATAALPASCGFGGSGCQAGRTEISAVQAL